MEGLGRFTVLKWLDLSVEGLYKGPIRMLVQSVEASFGGVCVLDLVIGVSEFSIAFDVLDLGV